MARWKADRVQKTDACRLALARENAEVVATLTAISVIFQRRGDQGRSLAYQRAARTIKDLREPVCKRRAGGTLKEIPFVGPKIAGVIEDLLQNGHSQYLEFLRDAPTLVQ